MIYVNTVASRLVHAPSGNFISVYVRVLLFLPGRSRE